MPACPRRRSVSPKRPNHLASLLALALALGACARANDGGKSGGGSASGGDDGSGGSGGTGDGSGDGGGATPGDGNGVAVPVPNNPSAGAGGGSQPTPNPSPQTVQAIGRCVSDANGLTFAWTGSTLMATFTGTGIAVSFTELTAPISWPGSATGVTEGNRYAATVDGQTQVIKPNAGTGTYTLASGLSAGSHTVKLVKLTEARVGVTRFNGFQVAGGQLTATTHTPSHRLLLIGDSITAGYGNLGTSARCSFSPETQDGSRTWGALAAQALGADAHIVAYSGKGTLRNNYESPTEIGNQTMNTLWKMALPDDPQSPYDVRTWAADAVVINLGTNDFFQSNPSQAAFVAAYQALVTQVRQAFPQAVILLAVGPMLYDNNTSSPNERSLCLSYIQQVVTALKDPQIHVFELVFADDSMLGGCDSHPNLAGHAFMAGKLQAALKQYAGW